MSREIEALIDRAHTQARHQHLHGAIETLRRALTLDPESSLAHYAMATVSIAHRRFKAAEHHLNAALGVDPDNPSLLRSLAHLYGLWNRRNKVPPLLEKAREIDPSDADTWAALAEHYREHATSNKRKRSRDAHSKSIPRIPTRC